MLFNYVFIYFLINLLRPSQLLSACIYAPYRSDQPWWRHVLQQKGGSRREGGFLYWGNPRDQREPPSASSSEESSWWALTGPRAASATPTCTKAAASSSDQGGQEVCGVSARQWCGRLCGSWCREGRRQPLCSESDKKQSSTEIKMASTSHKCWHEAGTQRVGP